MAQKAWKSEVRLTSDPDEDTLASDDEPEVDRKFVISILANFRGSEEPDWETIGERRFVEVDRDNFDEVLERSCARWRGVLENVAGQREVPVELKFRQLDDFGPDRIVEQVPALQTLLGLLRRLERPEGVADVAAEVSRWEPEQPGDRKAPPEPGRAVDGAAVLDSILSGGAASASRRPSGELDAFVREIVAPHAVKTDTERQSRLRQVLTEELSGHVRSILHDRSFQKVESSWRSLNQLVREAETGSSLSVKIAHLAKVEILQDVGSGADLQFSGMASLLLHAHSVPGSDPPALILADYEFTPNLEDLAVLERLGNIGRTLRAPVVSAVGPAMLGLDSFPQIAGIRNLEDVFGNRSYEPWFALRRSPAARWIALALPRLLVRLPYGSDTCPAETFDFEESPGRDHERLLWGNPAYGVAAALAAMFASQGWEMHPPGAMPRLTGLPLYGYELDGEKVTKPCAEALLSEMTVRALAAAGFLPLVSYRDSDIVALPCLQTIAEPRAPLCFE